MSQHTAKADIPDSPTDREREMREMILEYERGDEGLSSFCRRHGIKTGTFGWWKSEVRRRRAGRRSASREVGSSPSSSALHFVELVPPAHAVAAPGRHGSPDRHSQIRIIVSRGRQIEVTPGFDEETLARTIRVVEMTPC